jgi:hypothetical protein
MLTKLSVILFLVFCVLFSFAEESYARCGDCVNLTGKQQPGSWGPNSIDYTYANQCEGKVTVAFDKGNGGRTSERFDRGETKTVGCTSQDCPYSKFSEVCTEIEKQQSNPSRRSDVPAPSNGNAPPTGQSNAPAPTGNTSSSTSNYCAGNDVSTAVALCRAACDAGQVSSYSDPNLCKNIYCTDVEQDCRSRQIQMTPATNPTHPSPPPPLTQRQAACGQAMHDCGNGCTSQANAKPTNGSGLAAAMRAGDALSCMLKSCQPLGEGCESGAITPAQLANAYKPRKQPTPASQPSVPVPRQQAQTPAPSVVYCPGATGPSSGPPGCVCRPYLTASPGGTTCFRQ